MILVIGNKRYSSWSLRPWVLMRHFGITFEEKLIALDRPETAKDIHKYSPSGKVPVLIDGDISVWESLAIAEYLNEKFPDKQLWPRDTKLRARARTVANEMHAGFAKMRERLPHDLKKNLESFDVGDAQADIARVQEIWQNELQQSKGPFLFGAFSIADAMFAPVVNRFVSYGVKTEGFCRAYIDAMRALPAHREWIEGALAEDLRMPRYE